MPRAPIATSPTKIKLTVRGFGTATNTALLLAAGAVAFVVSVSPCPQSHPPTPSRVVVWTIKFLNVIALPAGTIDPPPVRLTFTFRILGSSGRIRKQVLTSLRLNMRSVSSAEQPGACLVDKCGDVYTQFVMARTERDRAVTDGRCALQARSGFRPRFRNV